MPTNMHVVFKTHLDIGFTDLAGTVVRQYMDTFIPQAIDVARTLRDRGGQERFLWTTGSWLIYEYLEHADARGRAAMETAIAAGDIRWHALPFTTHTEAMTPTLFRVGVDLSQELDRRFGVRTIAAKMTDVPGHTRGMVPLLSEAGVEFLHLGVNPASPAPNVPGIFRWREPESGREVIVMYHSGYGSDMTVDGLEDGIVFAHTGDNCGPQSPEQIIEQFGRLRQCFPGVRLRASTMDAFAVALRDVREALPVVEQELGDTWIHGIGTDPGKLAAFRALNRKLDDWQAAGFARETQAFARRLLLVPEHTWGLDTKKHLGDYVNYSRPDFEAARQRDIVDAPVPDSLDFARQYLTPEQRRYSRMEGSWQEQRDYLHRACEALADPAFADQAHTIMAELRPAMPDLEAVEWLSDSATAMQTSHFQIDIDPQSGALTRLVQRSSGIDWAAGGGLGRLSYQTFSRADVERYLAAYNVNMEHAWCYAWAIPDFGKPGLRAEDAVSGLQEARLRRLGVRRGTGADLRLVAELGFAASLHDQAGAPSQVWMEYEFPAARTDVRLRIQWFDKPANRMPEALWCSFNPNVRGPQDWRLHKLGQWISPLDVAGNGNRNLHGIDTGIRYEGPEGTLNIESLDAALVAPGRPRLLEYDHSQPDLAGGMHFNLYNNIWGTNFPLWYGEDAGFRFVLRIVNG